MEPVPCKDSQHNFQIDFSTNQMRCSRCPIIINRIDVTLIKNPKEGSKIIKEKEREWYIKELES